MEFVRPHEGLFESYRAACEESWQHGVTEWLPFEPEKYDTWKAHALQIFRVLESGEGLPEGYPRTVTLWCVDNGEFIGEIQLRPWLSAQDAEVLGHAAYAVRWSQWGKGYGTALLREAIRRLREMDVNPVLVACHEDNQASARVIEKCGGDYQKTVEANGEVLRVYSITP